MSKPFDPSRCRVTWEADDRTCRAVALDERAGPLLTMTFEFPDGMHDALVRERIEAAAIDALRAVLGR